MLTSILQRAPWLRATLHVWWRLNWRLSLAGTALTALPGVLFLIGVLRDFHRGWLGAAVALLIPAMVGYFYAIYWIIGHRLFGRDIPGSHFVVSRAGETVPRTSPLPRAFSLGLFWGLLWRMALIYLVFASLCPYPAADAQAPLSSTAAWGGWFLLNLAFSLLPYWWLLRFPHGKTRVGLVPGAGSMPGVDGPRHMAVP